MTREEEEETDYDETGRTKDEEVRRSRKTKNEEVRRSRKEEDTKTLTVLAACDRESGMVMASVVPRKGATGSYPAPRLYNFIKQWGD